jgi:tetratricopeptide (TPR) repeat protein
MKTIDFSYFIERYNAGEMDDTEQQWFQRELEENSNLQDEVKLRAKTEMVLADYTSLQLRNKLRVIEKQRAEAVPNRNRRRQSPIRYAAVITVLILLGSMLLFRGKNLTADEILDRFHTPYEAITGSRSQESTADNNYKTALDYYNIHDYSTAALFFNKVLEKNPGDMESTMLYGVSNFEEKNYPVAAESFTNIVVNNDNYYIEDAQWYLALCYVQTNEQTKAIEQLTMIRNSGSIYSKDASKVLRRIR